MLKPLIQRADGSAKGDWDVGLAVDVMEFASESDIIVIVSGDGDFEVLVSRIKQKYQNQVEVYGVPRLTAVNLMNAASEFKSIDSALCLG